MDKQCEICDKHFKVKPSQVAKGGGRFCCRSCVGVWKQTAYRGANNPKYHNALTHICIDCGNEFKSRWHGVVLRCPEHRKMANVGDRNWAWRGGKTKTICLVCGELMLVYPRLLKLGKGKYCSRICANTIKNETQQKKNTDIEQVMLEWLTKYGGAFPIQKQVLINKVGVVDFVVGTTVIECDGVYWHTKPGRPEKDATRDKKLNDLGYTVIRISDREMKQKSLHDLIQLKSIAATLHNKHRVTWQGPCNSRADCILNFAGVSRGN